MDVIEVERPTPGFVTSLASGAAAGLSVDLLFYPIDTIKTRLQSAQGFWRSGGLRGVYRGMGSVAVGSAPGASIFFVTYETCKDRIARLLYPESSAAAMASAPSVHMAAGTLGEAGWRVYLVRSMTERSAAHALAAHVTEAAAAISTELDTEVLGLYVDVASDSARICRCMPEENPETFAGQRRNVLDRTAEWLDINPAHLSALFQLALDTDEEMDAEDRFVETKLREAREFMLRYRQRR